MAFSSKVGSFNIDTAVTAGNTQAVTGVGFTPKVVIFWWSGTTQTSDGARGEDYCIGFGAMSGSAAKGCVLTGSDDGAATSDANRVVYDSYCIASTLNGTGSLDGAADWGSLDADGFTLTIDDQFSTAIRVSYLALGGTDPSAKVGVDRMPAATGNFSETGVGFQPKALIVAGAGRTGVNSFAAGGFIGIGWATATNQQGVVSFTVQDGQGTSNTTHYGFNGEMLNDAYSSSGSNRLDLVSFDADGYTVNKIDGGDQNYFMYIALGGDAQFLVGELNTATDGSDISENVGFTPGAILFLSNCYAVNTEDTYADHACLSIGAGTSASNRAAQGMWDQDNLADMETSTANYDTAVYANVKDDAIVGLMDIKSIDASGFTCVMDDTDPSAYWVTYLAIGAASAGGTQYDQAVAGAITPSGTIVNRAGKVLAGAVTPAGVMLARAGKVLAGALTPDGGLVKRAGKVLAGALEPSGIVAAVKTALVSLAGALEPAGALVLRTGKALAGAITPDGGLVRSARKVIAGAITPDGALSRLTGKVLSGEFTPSGIVATVKAALVSLAGELAPAGAVVRQVGKSLAGAITPDGALSRLIGKIVAGALSSAGDLVTQFIGGGTLYLQSVAGTLEPAGALVRQVGKSLTGALAPAGEIARAINKVLTGALTPVGVVAKRVSISLAGELIAAGALVATMGVVYSYYTFSLFIRRGFEWDAEIRQVQAFDMAIRQEESD